jgi:hypothetical protein
MTATGISLMHAGSNQTAFGTGIDHTARCRPRNHIWVAPAAVAAPTRSTMGDAAAAATPQQHLHRAIVAEDGFVSCECGLRVGSMYFHALHCEEQRAGPLHSSGWPLLSYRTVPCAHWPQPGAVARNCAELPTTEYTTAQLQTNGSPAKIASVAAACRLLLPGGGLFAGGEGGGGGRNLGCGMVAFSAGALAHLGWGGPAELHHFAPKRAGDTGDIVFPEGTPNSLLLFVKAQDAAAAAAATARWLALAGPAIDPTSVRTTAGFHHGGRDLTGFIDGTENPDTSLRCVLEQATIKGSHQGFLGGSFVFSAKFEHDLGAFRSLCPGQRSELIGRELSVEQRKRGSDSRIENPKISRDVAGSHVYRACEPSTFLPPRPLMACGHVRAPF